MSLVGGNGSKPKNHTPFHQPQFDPASGFVTYVSIISTGTPQVAISPQYWSNPITVLAT